MKTIKLIACCLIGFNLSCLAQVKLGVLIRDSMVLQRDCKLPLWGYAAPNDHITVMLNGKKYKATADTGGNWQVMLPPIKAGGPYTIEITGRNKIVLKEILFGDVWLCSGQSNMVHQMNIHDITYADEITNANYPQIRQCWIPALTNPNGPAKDLPPVYWRSAVHDEVRPFSAVAYFFAKRIYEKHKVPIGIINASVGGTPIEAWISENGMKGFSELQNIIQKNKDSAYINSVNRRQAPAKSLASDAGLNETVKWFDPLYQPKAWRNINIPGYWEDQGLSNFNGIVWYRREIDIPASMAGKASKVFLGRIVDADELYINGQKVGTTGYQYPQRRYPVAAGILKEGKNIFVIRVTNNAGKGGFVPDKPYCIFSGTDTIDLKGNWQYKPGQVYSSSPGSNTGISLQSQPTALFNAMIAPLINYPIKGICWYQGEANTSQAQYYAALTKALIKDWRAQWKNQDLPFCYVQLPGFMDYNYTPSESNWAALREAQLQSLSIDRTGMAVAIDLGEWNDIHPDNKKDVGERLALPALHLAYGDSSEYSGPLYQQHSINGNKITIEFSHAKGLHTTDGEPPAEFAIAGEDKKFIWAKTRISGNRVIVWSEEVPAPKYVRYAWADNPVNPNLINQEGLPASPFRTETDKPTTNQ